MRALVGLVAVLAFAVPLVLGQRQGRLPLRTTRVALGALLLFGTLGVCSLAGERMLHWVEFHEGLAVAGVLLLVLLTLVVPFVALRPAAAPGAGSGSTTRSPSPSALSPETP